MRQREFLSNTMRVLLVACMVAVVAASSKVCARVYVWHPFTSLQLSPAPLAKPLAATIDLLIHGRKLPSSSMPRFTMLWRPLAYTHLHNLRCSVRGGALVPPCVFTDAAHAAGALTGAPHNPRRPSIGKLTPSCPPPRYTRPSLLDKGHRRNLRQRRR